MTARKLICKLVATKDGDVFEREVVYAECVQDHDTSREDSIPHVTSVTPDDDLSCPHH